MCIMQWPLDHHRTWRSYAISCGGCRGGEIERVCKMKIIWFVKLRVDVKWQWVCGVLCFYVPVWYHLKKKKKKKQRMSNIKCSHEILSSTLRVWVRQWRWDINKPPRYETIEINGDTFLYLQPRRYPFVAIVLITAFYRLHRHSFSISQISINATRPPNITALHFFVTYEIYILYNEMSYAHTADRHGSANMREYYYHIQPVECVYRMWPLYCLLVSERAMRCGAAQSSHPNQRLSFRWKIRSETTLAGIRPSRHISFIAEGIFGVGMEWR